MTLEKSYTSFARQEEISIPGGSDTAGPRIKIFILTFVIKIFILTLIRFQIFIQYFFTKIKLKKK